MAAVTIEFGVYELVPEKPWSNSELVPAEKYLGIHLNILSNKEEAQQFLQKQNGSGETKSGRQP
jgi:hypothetical protein